MKRLAFALAAFWSLQVLMCLSAGAGAATTGESTSEHACAGHSETPGPSDSHDSSGGCAQHCASLSQAVAASPATIVAPTLFVVAIAAIAPSVGLPPDVAGSLARLELERPPPDLLARHSTLRI